MAVIIEAEIRFKRGHAANWTRLNPILGPGEPGFEIDTYRLKIGDGETTWNNLPYFGGSYSVSPDGKSISVNTYDQITIYGFDGASIGQYPVKGSDGKVEWVDSVKLYGSTGNNTDGAITQKAMTTLLNSTIGMSVANDTLSLFNN